MGLELHHVPVMVAEVLHALDVQPGGRYIDATLGEGGHAESVLRASFPGGQLMGIDADQEALTVASDRLAPYGDRFISANTNFRDLRVAALAFDMVPLHGILFDLGVSSLQLDAESRGFSFNRADPLDMRFSLEQQLTAADIVNKYSLDELANLIYQLGNEPSSRRISAGIIAARPLQDSATLADTILRSAGRNRSRRIHPATKTFQALRIAVNDELGALQAGLEQSVSLLGKGGRLAVISYQSLEDRIVKNFFRRESSECICPPKTPVCLCLHKPVLQLVTKRVIKPTDSEIALNRRCRSARLRIVERI